jgi:protein MBA1
LKSLAREKYVHLYRSFARYDDPVQDTMARWHLPCPYDDWLTPCSGDSKAISEMCLSSAAKSFQDRIAARPHGLAATWKLKGNHHVSTAIVSNRALLLSLPGYDETGIQQIVLRLRSDQSLQYDAASRDSRDRKLRYSPKEGEVLEYLVLQRQILRGVFKEWKVWGFANEWDMESIEEDAQLERELNAFQGSQAT